LQTILLLVGFGSSGGADTDLDSDTSGLGEGGSFDGGGDFDVGGDTDFDVGHSHGAPADTGFQLFTVRGFITFFTLFGWTGLVCYQSGFPTAACLIIAAGAGILGMAVTAYIMKSMMKLQSDGSLKLSNAIGKTATVYIRVPASRADRGKVNLVVQERLIEVNAVTDEPFDLLYGSEVVVVGMSSVDTLLVSAKNKK